MRCKLWSAGPVKLILSIGKGHCNDDVLTFNTQISTQWDGLRHYPYQDWPAKGQQM
jgi:hypothetical protein